MKNNAFYANAVYCFGYLPFIHRNFFQNDTIQMAYFIILWIMSIIGVVKVVTENKNKVVPETDFEKQIVELCEDIGTMIIEKNRLYGDSFRNIRKLSGASLGSSRYPLWMHLTEKLSRYKENNPDETEDIMKDSAGYCVLEAICSRLDDL